MSTLPSPSNASAADAARAHTAVQPGAEPPTGAPNDFLTARVRWLAIAGLLALFAILISTVVLFVRLHADRTDIDALWVHVKSELASREVDHTRLEALVTQLTAIDQRVASVEVRIDQLLSGARGADLVAIRDEAALLEIERLIGFAQQELQLGGALNSAVGALKSADARLGRLQRSQLLPLRRALIQDLERLQSLPQIDLAGMSLRIDQLAIGVDAWTLLADPGQALALAGDERRSGTARAENKVGLTDAKGQSKSLDTANPQGNRVPIGTSTWTSIKAWLSTEFGDLVRIRQVVSPNVLFLDATQANLLRERVRLRLLTARQALLTRNQRLLRVELAEVAAIVERYFDLKQPAVGAALGELRALSSISVGLDGPLALESVAAMRVLLAQPIAVVPAAAAASPGGSGSGVRR